MSAGIGWARAPKGEPPLDVAPAQAEAGSSKLIVLAPLSIEARAVRSGAPWADVQQVGMGPRRAARSAELVDGAADAPVLIAGFCGALEPDLVPGDIVLATEVRGPAGTTVCDDPSILAGVLRRGGLRVRTGPIASSQRIVVRERRRALERSGALAVDMESAWLAPALRGRPIVALRVVLDTHRHELYRPLRTVAGAAIAYRALKRASELVDEWARALAPREIVLAAPRASCAGVVRAIDTVRHALEDRDDGQPLYVRRQIVHNAHVVEELERSGARFVQELDEVPEGGTVIFSAHGVSPTVRTEASARDLTVIDATCPLVAKVHSEARRFAAAGYDIVLVGHAGHEEVEGTLGEAPGRIHLIARADEVEALEISDPERVAYLTQTTLAVDDTAEVIAALRQRFPAIVGPSTSDICFATQNRQDAVRALADDCDLILVVGSSNSSNSRRLVEVAERAGCPALLVEDAEEVPPSWLAGAKRVGLTAGASAPESLVEGVVRALEGMGGVAISERAVANEEVSFKLPRELRIRR